jgi:hypothetical protein
MIRGCVVCEEGTHESLFKITGYYFKLYNTGLNQ